MRRLLSAVLLLMLAGVAGPRRGEAQVRPDLRWRTLTTEHFRVHFTVELAALARRAARNAEVAYARLSTELVPPRGPVDIVLADNVDFSNGYATPYPTNRIVIYARPPVDEASLRNHEDWNQIVVTHELTHIFHMDRARGLWRMAQGVFGRAAPLFPNTYAPSWILEGLAVHYETRFGGGGRLAGTEFPMLARAAAIGGSLPSLDALSLGAPRFPGGTVTYLYGSFAFGRADTARMGRFVETSSARFLPWRHDANARAAFGATFTERWAQWRDSVTRVDAAEPEFVEPAGTVTTLTTHGFTARFPRFASNDTLVYVADDARSTPGLYRLALNGDRTRVGRRTSIDANVPLPDGSTLQAEFDYTDPYSIRSELTRESGRRRRQITFGDRLSHPDAHGATGRVVAVQTVPGSTSLVMMDSADDWAIHLIAKGTLDLNWADPRLSHDAQRIAAVRWEEGGRMSIVVLDADGTVRQTFAPRGTGDRRLTVVSSPVWGPGDTTLLFVSDHEGRPMVYRGDLRTGGYARIWGSATGLNTPDVSPDGRRIAAVELRADGFHVVTREMPGEVPLTLPAADTVPDPRPPVIAADTAAPDTRFSSRRTLRPSWWMPVVLTTDPGTLSFGGMTGARDVIGRHAYAAQLSLEPGRKEVTANLSYAYAGLGNPVVYLDYGNQWQHGVLRFSNGNFAGYLGQRSRLGELNVLLQRPRVRLGSYLLLGGELKVTDFRTYPTPLLDQLTNAALKRTTTTPAAHVAAGFSTLQRPQLSVSPEDGVTAAVSHRLRFNGGLQQQDVSETIASGSVAKSVPFPGFARHVIAARAAYGVTGHSATSAFSAGGVSGSSVQLAPGVVIGGEAHTFGVRGFDGGTQVGVRAAAASMEYRAPLALIGRGVKLLPVFFQKASVTAFADAGAAWCTRAVAGSFICSAPVAERTWLVSAGGELALDASLQYDTIYRFRLGYAHPVKGLAYARSANTIFFSLGSAF